LSLVTSGCLLSEKRIFKLIFELLWSPKSAIELPKSAIDSKIFSCIWFDKNQPPNVAIRPPIFCRANLENIHIFHPFLFWISFWCKYESFR